MSQTKYDVRRKTRERFKGVKYFCGLRLFLFEHEDTATLSILPYSYPAPGPGPGPAPAPAPAPGFLLFLYTSCSSYLCRACHFLLPPAASTSSPSFNCVPGRAAGPESEVQCHGHGGLKPLEFVTLRRCEESSSRDAATMILSMIPAMKLVRGTILTPDPIYEAYVSNAGIDGIKILCRVGNRGSSSAPHALLMD
eukprot:746882-Hanusia_phi.AAC.2